MLPIHADGSLGEVCSERRHRGHGPDAKRQASPHVHQVVFDPAGQHIVSVDLGTDRLEVCRLDDTGKLTQVGDAALSPGAGPRHVVFDGGARFAWVVNELDATIVTLPYDARRGTFSAPAHAVSLVPEGFKGTKSGAEIALHPTRRVVYASHRGPDAASYTIDERSGALTLLERTTAGIAYPRSFTIDPSGTRLYVCNQHGDRIVAFTIDARGRLHQAGSTTTPTPACLVWRR